MPLFLTEQNVADLFTMPDALDVVEQVLKAHASGEATNEPRRRVRAGGTTLNVMSGAMAAHGGEIGYLGHKSYTVSKGGARFFFSLYSAETGALLAFIEADRLGQMRTGAASGIATKYLARKQAQTVAIYGSGWQAQSQLSAICQVRPIREVRVYSRKPENRQRFCTEMREQLKIDNIRAVDRPELAAEGAEIIATITTAREPVFSGEWLTPGVHINAAGGNSLLRREVDDETLRRASLITVDSIEQARIESGEIVSAIEKGALNWERVREIRQAVSGEISRTSDQEITVFKSLGLAIEDVAAAALIYRRAVERKVGREF
jgi:alanine dehydrogenase